jgi:predicted nucleic acid-binding protein
MRADFPVVLDACVLAEAAVSDLFLRLAESPRLLLPRWSESIWEEARRAWVEKLMWDENLAESRVKAATEFFPEAMVTGFEHIVPSCNNHPKDRHVLAVAIHSGTEVIVTFNVKDFSREALAPWGITASHPADYLKVLFDHDQAAVTDLLHNMASKAQRTVPEMLGRLAWSVHPFAEYVARELDCKLPSVTSLDWRR